MSNPQDELGAIGELDLVAVYSQGRQTGVWVRNAPPPPGALATRAVLDDDCNLLIEAINGTWRYRASGNLTRPGLDLADAQLGDVLVLQLVEKPEETHDA